MDVGTHVEDICITEFANLKLGHQHRFIIYKLDLVTNIISIDAIGARDESYENFLTHLKPNEARYAVYDYAAVTDEVPPRKIEKLVFIFWSPDTQPVKSKMAYATGKEALKKKLQGLAKELQANEPSELEEKEMNKIMLG